MRKDIAMKWVDALRSGEYNQTQNKLADETGFCCLGVLCEIAVKEGVCLKDEYDFFYDNVDDVLPASVMEWAQIEKPNCLLPEAFIGIPYSYFPCDLTALNDQDNLSFDQIADLIEYGYSEL